jgi:nucleotide-binding universal stress UspA family protein
MYEQILAAVDDSPERESVLDHAAELAKATGGTVHVLHVQTIDASALGGGVVEEDTGAVRTLVQKSIRYLVDQGVQADGELREAVRPEIARTLLDAAKEKSVDLIVLGMRRAGGLSGLVLGSVADGVAHGFPSAPVLLIPDHPVH